MSNRASLLCPTGTMTQLTRGLQFRAFPAAARTLAALAFCAGLVLAFCSHSDEISDVYERVYGTEATHTGDLDSYAYAEEAALGLNPNRTDAGPLSIGWYFGGSEPALVVQIADVAGVKYQLWHCADLCNPVWSESPITPDELVGADDGVPLTVAVPTQDENGNLSRMGFWKVTGAGFHDSQDGDQLNDYEEYLLGTDPSAADTDGNGLLDHEDFIAGNLDCDGDGLADNQEDIGMDGILLEDETDPSKWDSDGDGLSDGWEVQWGETCGLSATDSDSDGDGTEDGDEDWDGDGFTNLEEQVNGTRPDNAPPVVTPPPSVGGVFRPNTADLVVTAADSDAGDVLSFTWTQTAGPAGGSDFLTNPEGQPDSDITAIFFESGSYEFSVEVTDGIHTVVAEGIPVEVNLSPLAWKVDVDATGNNDGTTWQHAFTTLVAALESAAILSGDEVWVARGTYLATDDQDESDSLLLKGGVALYGGFTGTEQVRGERNWAANPVVLEGDIDQDGIGDGNANAVGDSDSLMSGDSDSGFAVVDGFTLQHAAQSAFDVPSVRRLTLANCTFIENRTDSDGGAVNIDSVPQGGTVGIGNCAFRANSGNRGGGVCKDGLGTLVVGSCTFDSNSAANGDGGGVHARGALVLGNSVFLDNQATASSSKGGAVCWGAAATGSGTAWIGFCTFVDNHADGDGGALYLDAGNESPIQMVSNVFWSNSAGGDGDAVHCAEGEFGLGRNVLQGGLASSEGVFAANQAQLIDQGSNTTEDPELVDMAVPRGLDGILGTPDDGLAPGVGGPCFNRGGADSLPEDTLDADGDGNTAEALPLDVTGLPRVQGHRPEAGAYEAPGPIVAGGDIAVPVVVCQLPDISVTEGETVSPMALDGVFALTIDGGHVKTEFSYVVDTYSSPMVTATTDQDRLSITLAAGMVGRALVTVWATPTTGLGHSTCPCSFSVEVNPGPAQNQHLLAATGPAPGDTEALANQEMLEVDFQLNGIIADTGEISVFDARGPTEGSRSFNASVGGSGVLVSVPKEDLLTLMKDRDGTGILILTLSVAPGAMEASPAVFEPAAYTVPVSFDLVAPTVQPSVPAGTLTAPMGAPLALGASEGGCTIFYTVSGAADPNVQYGNDPAADSTNLTIADTTLLRAYATDPAGNVGPVCSFIYLLGSLPDSPEALTGSFKEANGSVELRWLPPGAGVPLISYRIYRALTLHDTELLAKSHTEGWPGCSYLKVAEVGGTVLTFRDDDIPLGNSVVYALSAVHLDGAESPLSSPATVDLTVQTTAGTDVAEARQRALGWILSTQNRDGSWNEGLQRHAATATVLGAISQLTGTCETYPHVRRSALGFLAGSLPADTPDLALVASRLAKSGVPCTRQQFRLCLHALKHMHEDQGQTVTTLIGWGMGLRYAPDAVATAMGVRALDRSLLDTGMIDATFDYLDGGNVAPADGAVYVGAKLRSDFEHPVPVFDHAPATGTHRVETSALVYCVLGRHRYSTANGLWAWIPNTCVDGCFDSSLGATVAALRYLPIDSATRQEAREFIANGQQPNGSWKDDPLLTAECLLAIAEPVAVYVIGSGNDPSHNGAMVELLAARGYQVQTRIDSDPAPSAGDASLVVISSSADPANLDADYATLSVPLLACGTGCLPALGLTGTDVGDTGTGTGLTVQIEDTDHPMAARFDSGSRSLLAVSGDISWGKPGAEAVIVATVPGQPSQATIFGYGTGSFTPAAFPAPARRAACFLGQDADILTPEGKDIIDAVIQWVAGNE